MNFNIYKLSLLISPRFHTILNTSSVLQQVRMISDIKTQKTKHFRRAEACVLLRNEPLWLVLTKIPAWCRTLPPTYHKSFSNCLVAFPNTSYLLRTKMCLLVPLRIIPL